MSFTQPVSYRFVTEAEASKQPASLTALCRQNDPQKALDAIAAGSKCDNQTLTLALKKTYEALLACGSYGPDSASDDAAASFYQWERVVNRLLEQKVSVTDKDASYGYLIGRGMKEKLEAAQAGNA